ncbi:MAG: hypothetical protein IPP87_11580 [Ideonella sp.]|jgi:hypothetical protein|nr:hypothetical protein [Ideonella sp.]MBL0149312.1 hypothetical protein [Ideonella sp.]
MSRSLFTLLLCATAVLFAGCDQLGIQTATALAAKKEADGKAVGGACRHAGRAIEDCYTLNKKADRPAVYAGWREMNEYMRENKIEPVIPVIKPEPPVAAKPVTNPDEADEAIEPAPKKVAASKH